jgi:Ca-activated chloride channel homolog
MPDAANFAFHFLRPHWLLLLLPVAAIVALLLRRQNAETQWGGVIAPNLLKRLLVKPDRRWRTNAVHLIGLGLFISILALAGPTWRRELPPFVEDKAPLMIALSVAPSMNERDVAPSRLELKRETV